MEKMPEQTKTEKLRQNNHLIKHGLPCLLYPPRLRLAAGAYLRRLHRRVPVVGKALAFPK